MPKFTTNEARRLYYVKRYGEDEGMRRYQAAVEKRPGSLDDIDPAMDGEQAPIRQAKQRAPQRRNKKPSKEEVYTAVGTGVYLADLATAKFIYPPWEADRLTDEEIGALARALGDEVLESERLLAWLIRAQKASKHSRLIWVCASIALPRLEKHGKLPAGLAAGVFGGASREDAAAGEQSPGQTSVPVASGTAYGSDRDDGLGEVGTDQPPIGDAEILGDIEVESGSGDIPGQRTAEIRFSDGRPSGIPAGFAANVRESSP